MTELIDTQICAFAVSRLIHLIDLCLKTVSKVHAFRKGVTFARQIDGGTLPEAQKRMDPDTTISVINARQSDHETKMQSLATHPSTTHMLPVVVQETKLEAEKKVSSTSTPLSTSTHASFLDLIERLGHTLFTNDQELLLQHAEQIAEEIARTGDATTPIQRYVDLIFSTRTKIHDDPELDAKLVTAASNAISLLNYGSLCGVLDFQLCKYRDWSYCRIPGANLNCAVFAPDTLFDHTDLSNTSLFRTHFHGCRFRHTNLRGAKTHLVQCLMPWRKNRGSNIAFTWSPDSKHYANDQTIWPTTGTTDKQVIVIGSVADAPEPSERKITELNSAPIPTVTAFAFSPDGTKLTVAMVGVKQTELAIWDVDTRECIEIIVPSTEVLYNLDYLAYTPDGRYLIAAAISYRSPLYVFDVQNEYRVYQTEGLDGTVGALAISRDSLYVAALVDDVVHVWKLRPLDKDGDDSQQPMEESATFEVDVFRPRSTNLRRSYLAFTPDCKELICAEMWWCTKFAVCDIESGTVQIVPAAMCHAAYDKKGFLLGCERIALRNEGAAEKPFYGQLPHHTNSVAPSVSPDGNYVYLSAAVVLPDPCAYVPEAVYHAHFIWTTSAMDWMSRFQHHLAHKSNGVSRIRSPGHVTALAISPNGSLLVTRSNALHLWDRTTGEHLGVVQEQVRGDNHSHSRQINDLHRLDLPEEPRNHKFYRASIAFSHDGRKLLSGEGRHMRLWDVMDCLNARTFKPEREWEAVPNGHTSGPVVENMWSHSQPTFLYVTSDITARFTEDDQFIVCHGHYLDHSVAVKVSSGLPARKGLVSHYRVPEMMKCVSSDGRFILASNGRECGFTIWDGVTKRFRCHVTGIDRITCMALTSDDSTLVVSNGHAMLVQIWSIDLKRLIERDPEEDEKFDYHDILALQRVIGLGQKHDFCVAEYTDVSADESFLKEMEIASQHPYLVCSCGQHTIANLAKDENDSSWRTAWTDRPPIVDFTKWNPVYKPQKRDNVEKYQRCWGVDFDTVDYTNSGGSGWESDDEEQDEDGMSFGEEDGEGFDEEDEEEVDNDG